MYVLFVLCTLLYVCHATTNVQLVPLGTDSKVNSRIVGGSNVEQKDFPMWQVSLRRNGNDHFCGGVIIDSRTVLTAAHCVDSYKNNPGGVIVGVGHVDYNNHHFYEVSKITVHEFYTMGSGAYPNDIAILTTSGEIEFNDFVGPIDMRTTDSNSLQYTTCTLTGWGRLSGNQGIPDILQTVDITLLSDSTCRGYWGSNINGNAHVCVLTNGKGACNGDSGGPLTCRVGGTHQLVGLASWVYSGCITSYPSVYVDVANYVGWVNANKN